MANQFTIGDLMRVDQGRQARASECEVKLVKVFHELKPEGLLDKFKSLFFGRSSLKMYYVIFKFSVKSSSGSTNTVLIRVTPDFDLTEWTSNKVKIYCTCSDFKYRSSYNLNQNNSLFKSPKALHNLGPALTTPPKKLSPSMLCKHSFAALNWLVNNYSDVMRTL